jgi:hypothetical protein
MTKRFITISGRILTYLLIAVTIASCHKDEDMDYPLNSRADGLYFIHRPSQVACAYANDDSHDTITCLNIRVLVTSSLNNSATYDPLQVYVTEGDKSIEEQIRKFLDPNGSKSGGMGGDIIEYRTEICHSIHITLYDKDQKFLSDITDMARFYYQEMAFKEDEQCRILINSDRKVLGAIKIGSTISEYLSYKPMIFAMANFIFPGIERDTIKNGNYAKIEIELENGTTLVTYTSGSTS